MEVSVAGPPTADFDTLAELASGAAARHSGHVALRHKADGEWVDVSYDDLGRTVEEVALGLIALGIRARERVAILSHTRPEWTYANLAILASGATSVSVYQTNSPEECEYVLAHSESVAVLVEDSEQLAKIRAVESRLRGLRHVIALAPGGDVDGALTLDELRARGREHDPAALRTRLAGVRPDDACVFMYTSGTTGPPKGCVLSHANYSAMVRMVEQRAVLGREALVYLFLPLAHAFALLVQFAALDLGSTIAYWEKDPQRIIPNLDELGPTYLPAVPRIFEKLYTLARASAPDVEALERAVEVGLTVREARQRGEQVPAELERALERADSELFERVRALFGGRIQQCVSGAAPIAAEILRFFYACGVPVLEGYGMTETATAATGNTLEEHRFGSVGKPLPGVEVRIADDGEVLIRGANIFRAYHRDPAATDAALAGGWLHTGDLGRLDEDGFLYITGRKKDIIITAGGKNIAPANIENALKQSRWISQAVVIGDRRPYLVALITLDPDELPEFAGEHGLSADEVAASPQIRAEIQRVVDAVNATVGPVEQVKRFAVLPDDLSLERGELTPTLKVKRNVVAASYAAQIDALYAPPRGDGPVTRADADPASA